LLDSVRIFREYDDAANRVCVALWRVLDDCLASQEINDRRAVLDFAEQHFPPGALARLLRRVVKDPAVTIRRQAVRLLKRSRIREVALPLGRQGNWDQTGWLQGISAGPLNRHAQGRRILERNGLPVAGNVGELRELLGIRSPQQLGYFLLASEVNDGPYTRFTIPNAMAASAPSAPPKHGSAGCSAPSSRRSSARSLPTMPLMASSPAVRR
jgi:hypothetical protein